MLGQRTADHVPGLSPVPKAVEEHKWRPRSDTLKGQPHVDLPPRRPAGSGVPAV
jgi:hypothetical protein